MADFGGINPARATSNDVEASWSATSTSSETSACNHCQQGAPAGGNGSAALESSVTTTSTSWSPESLLPGNMSQDDLQMVATLLQTAVLAATLWKVTHEI